jgi:CheY-like chemotaxis protein
VTMGEQPNWVLVLEDDPVQSALYEKILRAGRYQVTAIPDPLDFVSNLDTLPVPSAILLDIVLPGMDGVTVMQHLERHPRWCTVPVILMTASPTRDRVVAAQKLPVPPEGFLVKPVDPHGMLSALRALIACKEPIYLLRNMQRKRLALKSSMSDAVVDIEMTLRAAEDACEDCSTKMAEARKEIQSLRMMEGQFRDSLPASKYGVGERIRELEETVETLRQNLAETAETRRKTLLKRQDIHVKQKAIRELERQIQSLAVVLTRGKGLVMGVGGDASPGGMLGDIGSGEPSALYGVIPEIGERNGTDPQE